MRQCKIIIDMLTNLEILNYSLQPNIWKIITPQHIILRTLLFALNLNLNRFKSTLNVLSFIVESFKTALETF